MRRRSAASVASFVAVGGVVAFIFWQLRPDLLLAHTTASGGDMGAHVQGPAYLRDHLLPHWRLTGWTPDWYDGYPALTFYFPLPSLVIVALGLLIPYVIAFKLVTVLGLLTLPVAAWALGRLSGMRDPGPACLAVATLPFVFERAFTIYGGNIPSTLAGEFAFSISLSLALVFLGVVARGLETGRHRALAGGLLAATALCHVIPTLFALAGAAVLTLMRLDRRRLRWTLSAAAAGGAVAGFWVLPFLARLAYTTDMGWEKITTYRTTLLPGDLRWVAPPLALVVTVPLLLVLHHRLRTCEADRIKWWAKGFPHNHDRDQRRGVRPRAPGPALERQGPALLVPQPVPAGRRGGRRAGRAGCLDAARRAAPTRCGCPAGGLVPCRLAVGHGVG